MGATRLLRQIYSSPPLPNASFDGQTIMITGANVGLGQHAAAHFLKMGASRVIATCRSQSGAENTKQGIENLAGGSSGIVEVWELNYSSYDSVKSFCARADRELERLDAVLLNAGIATKEYELSEGVENSLTVNVISTTLLAALLLPVLRRSVEKFGTEGTLSVTGSEIHTWASFPERNEENMFQSMSDKDTKTMAERYATSKLLQLFAVREVAERTQDSTPFIIVNTPSPGLNRTSLTRSSKGIEAYVVMVLNALIAWEPEVGSRTLVHAVTAGKESHGVMLDNCQIHTDVLAPWVETDEGRRVQKKVWAEIEGKLEFISPGCTTAMVGKSK